MSVKETHDRLLADKPDGVPHDKASCDICNGNYTDPKGGETMTYTEQDVKNAVDEALAPLLRENEALKASEAEASVESKIAEATADFETKLQALQQELDNEKLRADTAEATKIASDVFLTAHKAETDAAAEADSRKAERLETVKTAAPAFDEAYLASRIDDWASMSQEVFDGVVEGFAAIASKSADISDSTLTQIPASTAMNHTRTKTTTSKLSELHELLRSNLDKNL